MKRSYHILLKAGVLLALARPAAGQPREVKPGKAHLKWADAEIGAIFHLDMQVFEPAYEFRTNWNYQPPAHIFNPTQLDTDQWIRSVKAAGANYAILVAKHCSGFSLWPTKAHPYSVRNSSWRNGQGDIVRDFINSCRRYGVRPGIYASTSVNAYLGVNNPGRVMSGKLADQERYQEVIRTQLTELWTSYGPLFEIWFDGGVLGPDNGGIDLMALLKKFQPQAITFQGPVGAPNNIRYVGNENGVAPYPCWSQADSVTSATGVVEIKGLNGNPAGRFWCPGEADFPLRKNGFLGGWFWRRGEDEKVRPVADLIDRYRETVGRNTNMLLGIVIDDRGLVPQADSARLETFGRERTSLFTRNIPYRLHRKNNVYTLDFRQPVILKHLVLQENLSGGENVRSYRLYRRHGNVWELICSGSAIGHKRIEQLPEGYYKELRLVIEHAGPAVPLRAITCH